VNMSRQVGAALGVAVVAAVMGTGATSGGSVAPDRSAVLVTAGAAGLAAVLALRGIAARAIAAPSTPTAAAPAELVSHSAGHGRLGDETPSEGRHARSAA
jgi:hypothetical protein